MNTDKGKLDTSCTYFTADKVEDKRHFSNECSLHNNLRDELFQHISSTYKSEL